MSEGHLAHEAEGGIVAAGALVVGREDLRVQDQFMDKSSSVPREVELT